MKQADCYNMACKSISLQGSFVVLISLFLFGCSSNFAPLTDTQTSARAPKVKAASDVNKTLYQNQKSKLNINKSGNNSAEYLLRKAAANTARLTREKLIEVDTNAARLNSTTHRLSNLETKFDGLEISVNRVSTVEEDLKDLIEDLDALSAMAPPEVPIKQMDFTQVRPKIITPQRNGQNRFVPPTREEVLAELQQRIVENKIEDKDKALIIGEAKILGIGQSNLVGLHLFSGTSTSRLISHWQNLAGENPDIFAGMNARIARVSFGVSEGVFYRLKAGPIANANTAFSICQALKNRNHGCIVSEFSGAPI